jgi:predicted unusual protein kinase regulating ubiquinone biosynthesis (AarF/ABC1/UbiB family)
MCVPCREISTCIMTISVSEGLLLQLDPAFDIVQKAMPYLLRSKVMRPLASPVLSMPPHCTCCAVDDECSG